MPFNRSEKTENQNNESRMNEKERTLKSQKAAERPASLNGIDKQLP